MKEFVKRKMIIEFKIEEKKAEQLLQKFERGSCEYDNFGLYLEDDENCQKCPLKKMCKQYTIEQIGIADKNKKEKDENVIIIKDEKNQNKKIKKVVKMKHQNKEIKKKKIIMEKIKQKQKEKNDKNYYKNNEIKEIHQMIKQKNRWNSGVVLLNKADKQVLATSNDKQVVNEIIKKTLEKRKKVNNKLKKIYKEKHQK